MGFYDMFMGLVNNKLEVRHCTTHIIRWWDHADRFFQSAPGQRRTLFNEQGSISAPTSIMQLPHQRSVLALACEACTHIAVGGATLVASAKWCGAHGGVVDSEIQGQAPPLARIRGVAGEGSVHGVTKVRWGRLTGVWAMTVRCRFSSDIGW